MSVDRILSCLILGCALVSSACGPSISNTGYTGTWSSQGLNTETTIAIVNVKGKYLFRWGLESPDGTLKVRCDWGGDCVETFDGEQMATYRMRTWVDEASGLLRVECRGKRNDPNLGEIDVHYLDELIVRKKGTHLVSLARGRDGELFEGRGHGRRDYDKISDSVVDPPPGRGAGG